MSRALAALTALLTVGVATPALAATIDFRSSAFASADWDPSFVYTAPDGVTLTITPGPRGARLYQDSTDGLGVRYSYEADEIESVETLTIGFSEEVLLTDLFLTDLFNENGYLERGSYALDGGPKTNFTASPSQVPNTTNGELTLSVGDYANWVTFTAPGKTLFRQHHEFSLGGLTYSRVAVPELDPAAAGGALLLLLGGLAVLSERRRTV